MKATSSILNRFFLQLFQQKTASEEIVCNFYFIYFDYNIQIYLNIRLRKQNVQYYDLTT